MKKDLKKQIYDILEKHRKLNGEDSKNINEYQFYYLVDDLLNLIKEQNAQH